MGSSKHWERYGSISGFDGHPDALFQKSLNRPVSMAWRACKMQVTGTTLRDSNAAGMQWCLTCSKGTGMIWRTLSESCFVLQQKQAQDVLCRRKPAGQVTWQAQQNNQETSERQFYWQWGGGATREVILWAGRQLPKSSTSIPPAQVEGSAQDNCDGKEAGWNSKATRLHTQHLGSGPASASTSCMSLQVLSCS